MMKTATFLFALAMTADAFAPIRQPSFKTALFSSTNDVAAPSITGEELEKVMTEWDTPLIVDAYATWYVRETV